jgi:BirA family biotin operon repressor/biotin-[acetyl-CoA-carboxylase] ligase
MKKIQQYLTPEVKTWITSFHLLDTVVSTQSFVNQLPLPTPGQAQLCLAEAQTEGYGKQGRPWIAPPGRSLAFSLRFITQKSVLGTLPWVMGAAVVQALEFMGIQGAHLKWPNDIYFQGVKLGGVLVEGRPERSSGGTVVTVGIGVNEHLYEAEKGLISQPVVDIQHIAPLVYQQLDFRPRWRAAVLNAVTQAWHQFEVEAV